MSGFFRGNPLVLILSAASMVSRAEDREIGRPTLDDVRIPTDTPADNVFMPGRRAKAQRARVRRDDRDVMRDRAKEKRARKASIRLENAHRQATGDWQASVALANRNCAQTGLSMWPTGRRG